MNNKTTKQPNLFCYATKELSQDAFICWLLSWADPEYQTTELHNCAVELIKVFFQKTFKECPSIEKINIKPQYKKIDILCIINDKYPILIEDKTNTKNHSKQLERYLSIVKKEYKQENIIPIYFKTGFQLKYEKVKAAGFSVFNRRDFLIVLGKYKDKITNNIFMDYYNYLDNIEQQCLDYKETSISKWKKYQWQGFFTELHEELDGDGRKVSNKSGGFWGYWWHYQGSNSCEQYLQLEQDKFCFKIWVKNKEERQSLRKKWHEIIEEKDQDYDLKLVKPSRFGHGDRMTVCVFKGEYREFDNGKINLEKTIDRLKRAEELLKSVQEK